MIGIIEIEAGKSVERHVLSHIGIRGTGYHIDLMAQLSQRTAEIFYIYPLPPACRITAIG
jgi:hypothetical protein